MTREPDRFEAKARELDRWIVRHYGVPESYTSVNEITAALRQAESDALKRVADNLRGAANGWRIYEHATAEQAFEVAIRELLTEARALASPAAAPAAEVCGAGVSDRWPRYEGFTCELPKGHGGFHLQGDTTWSDANTPSEPVAPCPGCVCANAPHRYCPICADRIQDAEKRIAELEAALRRAHGALCICVVCEQIASPAAQGKETRKP